MTLTVPDLTCSLCSSPKLNSSDCAVFMLNHTRSQAASYRSLTGPTMYLNLLAILALTLLCTFAPKIKNTTLRDLVPPISSCWIISMTSIQEVAIFYGISVSITGTEFRYNFLSPVMPAQCAVAEIFDGKFAFPCRIERLSEWFWGVVTCNISWEQFTNTYMQHEFVVLSIHASMAFAVYWFARWHRRKQEAKEGVMHAIRLATLETGLREKAGEKTAAKEEWREETQKKDSVS